MNRALAWIGGVVFLCSQYSPDAMREVVSYREMNGLHIAKVDGFVAVPDHQFLGDIIWIRQLGADRCESFQVVDWSSPYMKRPDGLTGGEWMRLWNVGVELDYETAVRWGTVGEMAHATRCDVPALER